MCQQATSKCHQICSQHQLLLGNQGFKARPLHKMDSCKVMFGQLARKPMSSHLISWISMKSLHNTWWSRLG